MNEGAGFGKKEIEKFLRGCEEAEEVAFEAATKLPKAAAKRARYLGVAGSTFTAVAETPEGADGVAAKSEPADVGVGGDLGHHASKVALLGKTHTNALSVHPPSQGHVDISFDIDASFGQFTVATGLDDSIAEAAALVTFEVLGDGVSLWESRGLYHSRDVDRCIVNVFSVNKLTLRTSCSGDNRDAFAVWAGATLSGDGAASLLPGMLLARHKAAGVLPAATVPIGTLVTLDLFDDTDKSAVQTGATNTVRVRMLDEETGLTHQQDMPFDEVVRVDRVYGCRLDGRARLYALAATTSDHLARHGARQAVTALLQHWPAGTPLTQAAVGGAARLVKLVKLVAASQGTFLRSGESDMAGDSMETEADSQGLLATLRGVMKDLLRREASSGSGALGKVLVKECVEHFVDSTKTDEVVVVESLHPHPNRVAYGGRVCFPGATALRITFHDECRTADPSGSGNNKTESVLEIHSSEDQDKTSLVAARQGNKWANVTVVGDTLWWRFRSNRKSGSQFGFRFFVTPVAGRWINESQIGQVASLEWACWVLHFLLSEASEVVGRGAVHNKRMYDALVRYLRTKGTPTRMKPTVVGLLTQLLVTPDMFPAEEAPDLDSLSVRGGVGCKAVLLLVVCVLTLLLFCCYQGVEEAVMRRAGSKSKSLFLPPRLLQLCELVMMRRAALRYFQPIKGPGRKRGVHLVLSKGVAGGGEKPSSLSFSTV